MPDKLMLFILLKQHGFETSKQLGCYSSSRERIPHSLRRSLHAASSLFRIQLRANRFMLFRKKRKEKISRKRAIVDGGYFIRVPQLPSSPESPHFLFLSSLWNRFCHQQPRHNNDQKTYEDPFSHLSSLHRRRTRRMN